MPANITAAAIATNRILPIILIASPRAKTHSEHLIPLVLPPATPGVGPWLSWDADKEKGRLNGPSLPSDDSARIG
jgi:hypothetical protein